MNLSWLLQSFVFYIVSDLVIADLTFISRDEWEAQDAKNGIDELQSPVDKVIICHSATDSCEDKLSCGQKVRLVQEYQMDSLSFSDIAYNFLIGNDGNIYNGRGWSKVGAHTRGYNVGSIGISFIGTFNNHTPSDRALSAAQELIAEGFRIGKISKDYKLYGQRQLRPTTSPGDKLYSIIKKWPNWSRQI